MTDRSNRRAASPPVARVRPARVCHVADMHEALVRVQQQRTEWQRHVDVGVTPEVPLGLADVQVACQRVAGSAGRARRDSRPDRRRPPVDTAREAARARSSRRWRQTPRCSTTSIERATLRTELAGLGLEPLLAELSVRHVPEERVAAELEFAWWQSALEHLLRGDRALLGANTAVVDRLERDFRLVDEAHAGASGPLLAAQLATQWRIGIVDEPDEAAALKRLRRGQ